MTRQKPAIRYKLTDADGYTRRGQSGETLWKRGTVVTTDGRGPLCAASWCHVYTDPLLALFLDPIHGAYTTKGKRPRVIQVCCTDACLNDYGLKEGWARVAYVQRIKKSSAPTTTQRVAFGILCGLEVCKNEAWRSWAKGWLNDDDRTFAAACAAASAVAAYADAAAVAAADAAARAADAAAFAARAKRCNLVELARKAMELR